ncbi:MAG: DUF4573 domain-containing protein [Planctomycetia bacterium]|nr:MAG: DUF4573 domain-containing protein [Planctomycetia bacterium]
MFLWSASGDCVPAAPPPRRYATPLRIPVPTGPRLAPPRSRFRPFGPADTSTSSVRQHPRPLRPRSSARPLRPRSSARPLRPRSSARPLRPRSSARPLRPRSSARPLRPRRGRGL